MLPVLKSKSLGSRFSKAFYEYRYRYLLIIPGIIFFIVFCYLPMVGNIMAFENFSYAKGIFKSEWVGLDNFKMALKDYLFLSAFKNQIIISFFKMFIVFPMPIILSLLLNQMMYLRMKRIYQTILTFPHFISWVIVFGIFYSLLSDSGVVNQILVAVGMEKQNILTSATMFRPLLYLSDIWKEVGWESIIYLAALTGINPELYQASSIDGANRWKQLIHVTWPGIQGLISLMFILNVGHMMSNGFYQILNLYNPMVYEVADTIDTYVFRTGIQGGAEFGYTTAIGLFKGVINLVLLYSANFIMKQLNEEGLF